MPRLDGVRFEHARPRMGVGRLGALVCERKRRLAAQLEYDLRLCAFVQRLDVVLPGRYVCARQGMHHALERCMRLATRVRAVSGSQHTQHAWAVCHAPELGTARRHARRRTFERVRDGPWRRALQHKVHALADAVVFTRRGRHDARAFHDVHDDGRRLVPS